MELITDFRKSNFTWLTNDESYGRFSIESVLEYDNQTFYLGSAVMACNMYKQNNLIINPSYLYQILLSDKSYHIFRTPANGNSAEDSAGKVSERFKQLNIFDITTEVTPVEKPDIKCSLLNGKYILAKVNINSNRHHHFTLTFPVKHINYSEKEQTFQAETGMIAIPSQTKENRFQLAYVAFNNFDSIELNLLADHPVRSFCIFKTVNCSTLIYTYNT